MPLRLKLLIGVTVTVAVAAQTAALALPGAAVMDIGTVGYWVAVTLVASAFPVFAPGGAVVSLSIAPILATVALLGPAAAGIVAGVGTTEWRELKGDVPWYGTLYNKAGVMLPAIAAGFVYEALVADAVLASLQGLTAVVLAGVVYVGVNSFLAALVIATRQGKQVRNVLASSMKSFGVAILGLAPLSWLMAIAFGVVGPFVAAVFALPLYTTRSAYKAVVEIRDMFTQTIRALASAIDARDSSTKKHSANVSRLAVDTGKLLGCSESELEQLEWAGLLHDVGKIGIPDAVLLKAGPLDKAERAAMNQHPEMGARILVDVKQLAPELPIIRHHHEWYNGSGYPDHLVGEDIPFLSRIIHVVDAFEAMTAVRPYRKVPMSNVAALEELRRFAGVQFDPRVVEAFARTEWAQGRRIQVDDRPPVAVPTLADVAARRAGAPSGPSGAPVPSAAGLSAAASSDA